MDEYSCMRDQEDNLIRDLLNSLTSKINGTETKENNFDFFEEHICKGGGTETWLVPGGKEFWLVFNLEPKIFTWIEYCPYCGYRPPNLKSDWGNTKMPEAAFKIEGKPFKILGEVNKDKELENGMD